MENYKGYINQFIKFLIYNQAYDDFLYNVGFHCKFDLKFYLKKTRPHRYISNAFTWSKTSQSHEYWSILSYKWSDKLEDLGYDKQNCN